MAKALVAAEVTWTSGRSGAGDRRTRSPDERPERAPAKKQKYGQYAKGGKRYCVEWNRGKCSNKQCPKHHLHHCNVVMPNGKICHATDHRACDHGER